MCVNIWEITFSESLLARVIAVMLRMLASSHRAVAPLWLADHPTKKQVGLGQAPPHYGSPQLLGDLPHNEKK